jgi:hypothetical protein
MNFLVLMREKSGICSEVFVPNALQVWLKVGKALTLSREWQCCSTHAAVPCVPTPLLGSLKRQSSVVMSTITSFEDTAKAITCRQTL